MVMKIAEQTSAPRGVAKSIRPLMNLKIGDRAAIIAEVTQVKQDPAHIPPKWVLYNLYDGTTIRAFGPVTGLKIGDEILADLEVQEGKPFQNQRQLVYKLRTLRKISKADLQFTPYLEKLALKSILRKSELQGVPSGTRVKLFTQVRDPNPKDGQKGKFRKVIITDAEGTPLSLWLPLEAAQELQSIQPNEYFLLKATVRTVSQNQSARYLAFESLLRGAEAYKDPLAQQFLTDRIKYYLHEAYALLKQKKEFSEGSQETIAALLLSLQGMIAEFDKPSLPPVATKPDPQVQTIKFCCRKCQRSITLLIYKLEDIPSQCPHCQENWSSFGHNFQYELLPE